MSELTITVPGIDKTQYAIHIGRGLLSTLLKETQDRFPGRTPFIITDRNLVEAGHLDTLQAGRKVSAYVIDPPGEIGKHIQTVVAIIEAMEKAYLGRDSVVIALGGGAVGDIAGFAAAVFKRGVPVIQVPTTTVAQADSAVGGKTGVDSSLSKNAFGAFWHPAAVWIDVDTLQSLNDRDFRAGLAESIKHAMIRDADYFAFLETHMDDILDRDPDVLTHIALRNCRIKGHIVQIDPYETNMRRILNYGHTIGHAIESASRYRLRHGEAVAIGIIGAGLIEIEMGLGDTDRLSRVQRLMKKLGLPVTIPSSIAEETLVDLIKRDKKAVEQWPKFILISQLGRVHRAEDQWAVDVQPSIVEKVLQRLY